MAEVLLNALARKAQLRRDPKTKRVEWNTLWKARTWRVLPPKVGLE